MHILLTLHIFICSRMYLSQKCLNRILLVTHSFTYSLYATLISWRARSIIIPMIFSSHADHSPFPDVGMYPRSCRPHDFIYVFGLYNIIIIIFVRTLKYRKQVYLLILLECALCHHLVTYSLYYSARTKKFPWNLYVCTPNWMYRRCQL